MIREIKFRYIVVRNGVDFSELHSTGTPTIRMDEGAEIKTSLTGEFLLPDDGVNLISDEIRVEMIIDGITHNLGVYLPASVTVNESETTKSINLEAYDRCWRVQDTRTENRLHLSAGSNYVDKVVQLLAACGISLISKTASNAVLAEDREDWDIGTSYLEIINQLLREINYNPLWFDSDGLAIIEPASIPTAAHIEHTLDDTEVISLLKPAISRETDVYSAPNVFICVCSNVDKNNPMIATSENVNPQSPLSIQRRGRRICSVVQVDNVADQTELQSYADRLCNESMITGETITVKTGLLPGFGVNDVTSIRYGELFAVCIERAWSMTLTVGGEMTHTLEKVVINLG